MVIAIICLLAALLLPALSRAKIKAHQTRCLSNLRQLALAQLSYTRDHDALVPYRNPAYPGGSWLGTLVSVSKNTGLMTCPAAPLRGDPPSGGNQLGTVEAAWVRWTDNVQTMFIGSYAYNAWLCPDIGKNSPWIYSRPDSIETPVQTPVFVDANWIDLTPVENEPPCRISTKVPISTGVLWVGARSLATAGATQRKPHANSRSPTSCRERSMWPPRTDMRNWSSWKISGSGVGTPSGRRPPNGQTNNGGETPSTNDTATDNCTEIRGPMKIWYCLSQRSAAQGLGFHLAGTVGRHCDHRYSRGPALACSERRQTARAANSMHQQRSSIVHSQFHVFGRLGPARGL